MKKGQISNALRQLRLIYWTDWLRYYYERYKNRNSNKDFKRNNPNVKLPPDYLLYESFQIDYERYYTASRDTARDIVNSIIANGKKLKAFHCRKL